MAVVGVAPAGDDVTHGLVDDRLGHGLGIEDAVARVRSASQGDSLAGVGEWAQDDAVEASARSPLRGLMTLIPCTSWSYWRMIHSLLAMFGRPRRV